MSICGMSMSMDDMKEMMLYMYVCMADDMKEMMLYYVYMYGGWYEGYDVA